MGAKQSFLAGVRDYFAARRENAVDDLTSRVRLSGKPVRVPHEGRAFKIEMGKQILCAYPEHPMDQGRIGQPTYRFMDPDRLLEGIYHDLQLAPGSTLSIDRNCPFQSQAFTHPRDAFRRHLQVRHEGDSLVFRDSISELGTYVSPLTDEANISFLSRHKENALKAIVKAYGGPLEPLKKTEALETLRAVNRLLRKDSYRRLDSFGNAGGLVELPQRLVPIIVGDLHGQVNNLLKILSENSFMEALERGDAALVFLGDAIHEETQGQLESMDSSLLIMDLIFKLKLSFPENVIFLIGNHDSFSPEVMKGGVPQSLLWDRYVAEMRGAEYRQEMVLFYQQSPLVVLSDDFFACHAGPPRCKTSIDELVNIRQNPTLLHEITWTRARTPGFPAGYTRADVRRFRKSLQVRDDLPFIVGHYPLSRNHTIWLDAAQINNHHIVYSARTTQLAVLTRVSGTLLPEIYSAEPLLELINHRTRTSSIEQSGRVKAFPGQERTIVR